MSPVKRRQVMGWPLAPVSCCWETLFAVCTLFTFLVHPYDEPHEALLLPVGCCGYPLGFVDEGLYEKHTHSARFLFACHFAIDIGWRCRRFHAGSIINDCDFELIMLHGEHDADGDGGVH